MESPRVSSEHSSASMAPKGLPKGSSGASKGSPRGLQGVPPGAAGRLWELLGVPKRIQKKALRAPLFSWFLFTTLVFIFLNGIRQVASTAIQPAGHNPASQPPRLRMPHRGESKGGGAAVCRTIRRGFGRAIGRFDAIWAFAGTLSAPTSRRARPNSRRPRSSTRARSRSRPRCSRARTTLSTPFSPASPRLRAHSGHV